MTDQETSKASPIEAVGHKIRPVGSTEYSWCKAVPGGTGITVLALLLSKPLNIPLLQSALHKLQIAHPILNSQLYFDPTSSAFSCIISPAPQLQIQTFDLSSTAQILQSNSSHLNSQSISPFHLILEHELNKNSWQNLDPSLETAVFLASLYTLENGRWVLALRLHTSVCDRTSMAALRRGLSGMIGEGAVPLAVERVENEFGLGIENYIPSGKANKPFWARGVDMLGYTLNAFRLANLSFKDTELPRASQVVKLQLNSEETDMILSRCKSRDIKLCGLLAAAGLIAARSLNGIPDDQWEKYAITTLVDCRSILDPVLSSHHIGFYHSAILNTHDVKGGEDLWKLATRTYTSFTNAKRNNKHFSDMADLNFLMCQAIDNPGLTPSASLRTSLLSVFEDSMIDQSKELQQVIGLEDFIGCGSTHGVGPSLALFDTIRDGELDCACVYPSPLHSREQMQEFVHEMKRVLLDGSIG
ncbi:Hypothetical predicted protein [Olea europaea subsp. europaea]|uniref:Phthiocerol/phthiodiolone dimycocerosyl transferase C-terminal domain-containing protein n=1 Tax=Olea europaea subsp. europaea TaxID=158383 RepID=A0A8S0UUK9_OLEEU|nr:Hypothetical predicted protein [Olea europaea subsp. europaea]